jgi:hypothetical protein
MKKIALFFLVFAVLSTPAYAETVLRVGDDISVDADQVVDGDYYVSVGPFGNTSMSGTVNGDMYALGGSVTVNGVIDGDLAIAGGVTQVHASTSDDVRVLSGETTIAEHVGGDLVVIGGTLTVLSSASVDGDIIFFGGNADISGVVGGSIHGSSNVMRIDGTVGKDVDLTARQSLTLGDRADIGGNVTYGSEKDVIRAQNAHVGGSVSKTAMTFTAPHTDARSMLIPGFVILFATLALYLLFRREIIALCEYVLTRPGRSALFGLATILLGPILSVTLILTVLGALAGVISLSFTILALSVGVCLSGVIAGAYLSKLFTKRPTVSLLWILIGTALLQGLLFVPLIGMPIFLVVLALSVGGVIASAYRLLS